MELKGAAELRRFVDRLPLLSLRQLACIIAFVVGFLQGCTGLGDYDFWWHLAAGRAIVEHGGVLHTDPFSFTTGGAEWVMHEWSWEVVLYALYTHFGPVGVILLKSFVSGLVCLAMLYLALRRGATTLVALGTVVLATMAMSVWLNERPQILQPVLILAALHLFQSARRGSPNMLWWYPPLMVLWVNSHGSFPMGIILLALFCVTELFQFPGPGLRRSLPMLRARPSWLLAMVFALSLTACLLGPNGIRGAMYPLDYFNGKLDWAIQSITEWASPNWHDGYMGPLEGLVLLTIAALALSPLSPTLFDLVLLLFSAHMMLQWGRNGALFATIAAPIVAVHLSAWLNALLTRGGSLEEEMVLALRSTGRVARVAMLALALAALTIAACRVPWTNDPALAFSLGRLPVKAVEVTALNELKGPALNVYHWGGYLIWRFYGERQVFMDGRADVYTKELWEDYRQVSQGGSRWKEALDRHNVQYLIIETWWAVRRALDMSGEFTCIYEDTIACVYVRNNGDNSDVLERFRARRLQVPPDAVPDLEAILGR